jgi:hypothetical protein
MDYPGKYNNDVSENEEIFKDKVVVNQPSGNIEFVNTKDSESIAITHKNGGFMKLDKFGSDILTTVDKREHVMGDTLLTVNGKQTQLIDEGSETITLGDTLQSVGDVDKWKVPMFEIKKAQRELHDSKRLFELKRVGKKNSIDQAPGQSKSGSHAACPTDKNESKILLTSDATVTVAEKNVMPRQKIIKITDNVDEYKIVVGSEDRCMTCWGKLLSPSTQDGNWATEGEKQKIAQKREEVQKKIHQYEKQLGQNKSPNGGSSIQTISKNLVTNVGLVFNDFESFRKDPAGKLVPCGVKIDPLGTTVYTQYRETSLIEHVDVEKFPGGSYDLNISDGWKVTTGSNGIDFKTTGPVHIFGPIVHMTGEQVAIGSRGELSMEAERIDLTADVISLRPKKLSRKLETGGESEEEQQVLIDGNLNVGLNAVVRGGLHVEGELTTHHITAPCEYQITETDFVWGNQKPPISLGPCVPGINGVKDPSQPDACDTDFPKSTTYATLLPGALIGYAIGVDSGGDAHCLQVYSVLSENFAQVDPHFHYFKNVPLKLFQNDSEADVTAGSVGGNGSTSSHDAVRAVGARNNWTKPVLPNPVINSKTENTVINKLGGDSCAPLTINKSDWNEPAQNDSLPDGEGVRTSKYTDQDIKQRVIQLEKDLEAKYLELKKALSELKS